jgi:transposase
MPGAYSEDLRSRVIEAATNGGSIRAAARRFKVSASSAIKWMQQLRETGSAVAKPTGGDRRSQRIGEHAAWLLALAAAEPDLTLTEVKRRLLEGEAIRRRPRHGVALLPAPRHQFQKKRFAPLSRSGRTSPQRATHGRLGKARSTPSGLCSSTRLEAPQI